MGDLSPNLQSLTVGLPPKERADIEASIASSPYLRQIMTEAVNAGTLKHIRVGQPGANEGGHYDEDERAIYFSADTLSDPVLKKDSQTRLDIITSTLGHETGHALYTKNAAKERYAASYAITEGIRAAGPGGEFDATPLVNGYIRSSRRDEALAEIHAWNALASRLEHLQAGPPSRRDILQRANPSTDCVNGPPEKAKLAPGIILDADMQMSDTRLPKAGPINLEPVAKCHFDQPRIGLGKGGGANYTNYYGAYLIEQLADDTRGWADPPTIKLDMAKLGLDKGQLESTGLRLPSEGFSVIDVSSGRYKHIVLHSGGSGMQGTPDQVDVALSDAREQTLREANRQGLSQDQAQQFVQGAATTITMGGTPSARMTNAETEDFARQEEAPVARQAPPLQSAEPLAPPPTLGPREDEAREREQARHARTDTPAPLPPDFAPSRQQAPDLRDTSHPGHDAFREMRHKVSLYEARQSIPHGEHTDRVAAALLQSAVENNIHYSKVQLVKDTATGQAHLLDRTSLFQSEQQCPRIVVDMMQMSSQPVETSSQRLDETVSRHNAVPAQTHERTQRQSQALEALSFDDQVMFARIRRDVPGHVSDAHVGLAMQRAKQEGMRDANSIGTVMMIGDQVYLRGQGEAAKDLAVDVTKAAPTLQASVEATNTLNEQRAPQLALQQNNSTQDDPGAKGPRL